MLEEFKNYVNKFDIKDANIKGKYHHSCRVKELSKLIAKHTGLNDKDIKIVEVIGLLHDYGRFPQWEKYHTYVDHESIDHAELGVELLFEKGDIKKFWPKEENYDEIYDAIKYHNKYKISDHLSNYKKTLCKIIRDADKVDILYLLSENIIKEQETDEPITEKISKDFKSKKLLLTTDKRNPNDTILAHLAFVFDLNYKYSFRYLYENKIIDKYFEQIKNKEKFRIYFEIVQKYIEKRMIKC